jgi:alanine dehydrogenase
MSATSSTSSTLDVAWTEPDAVLTFVSRREVPDDLHARVPDIYRLGDASLPIGTAFPGLDWFRGGYAGVAVGDRAFRARLPKRRAGEADRVEDDLPLLLAGLRGRRSDGRAALIAVGTQGLQFAAVAGYVVRRAEAEGLGTALPDDWFLQDIRD